MYYHQPKITYISMLNSSLNIKYNQNTDYIEIYYDGAWNNVIPANFRYCWLFDNGNQFHSITGDWFKSFKGDRATIGTALQVQSTVNDSTYQGTIATTYAVDLTKFTKLCYHVSSGENPRFLIGNTSTTDPHNATLIDIVGTPIDSNNNYYFDISNYSGSYRIFMTIIGAPRTVSVDKVWLA